MSPHMITKFLSKRFDLAEDAQKHPPLTIDQINVREKLL